MARPLLNLFKQRRCERGNTMFNEREKIGWILLFALGVPILAGTISNDLLVATVAAEMLVVLLIMGWRETRR